MKKGGFKSSSPLPLPSSSSSSSTTTTTSSKKKSTTLLLKWFILVFITTILFLLAFSYRTVHIKSMSDTNVNEMIMMNNKYGNSLSNLVNVQKLLDETNSLIKELGIGRNDNNNDSNSTMLSKAVSNDIVNQSNDTIVDKKLIPLQTELLSVYSSLAHTEDTLTRCVDERHRKEVELDRCQTALEKYNENNNNNNNNNNNHLDSLNVVVGASSAKTKKWLVIGIPTIPRAHNEKYLLQTLESINLELPSDPIDVLYGRVLVFVVNVYSNGNGNGNGEHAVFEEAKALYSEERIGEKSEYFRFVSLDAGEVLPDPIPGRNEFNDMGNANHPGYKVRKQTRNLASVVKKTLSLSDGDVYLFLEDDMRFCSHGFTTMQYLLDKANRYHPNWLAIRASYGMNGVFMRSNDAQVFADYMLKHQSRRPPDHLVVEWYAGETKESAEYKKGRKNIGFRYNLFSHMGSSSTLRHEAAAPMPVCYEQLLEPVVFKVEAFDPGACPLDDVWPCDCPYTAANGFTKINFDSLRK